MIYDSFPEAFFPISPDLSRDYCLRLEVGELNAKKSSVIFCGLIRNIGTNFLYFQKRVEKIGSFFGDYRAFFYENDSTDNTVGLLRDWAIENPRIAFKSETLSTIRHEQDHSEKRRIDMAYYRNQYLAAIQNKRADYVIVLDTDIVGGYSYEGILHSLSYDFDVVASNSLLLRYRDDVYEKIYYDSWAFRKLDHPAKHLDEEINTLNLRKGDAPFEVLSAFGGLAIYRADALTSGKYKYTKKDCDHVTLHKAMKERGYKIWVNPSMISLYSPTLYTNCL